MRRIKKQCKNRMAGFLCAFAVKNCGLQDAKIWEVSRISLLPTGAGRKPGTQCSGTQCSGTWVSGTQVSGGVGSCRGCLAAFFVANRCRKKTRYTVFRYTVFRYTVFRYTVFRYMGKLGTLPIFSSAAHCATLHGVRCGTSVAGLRLFLV